ncbi:MAG TPA: phage tail sheath subtilisin-like domain-containing protein [Chloroflexota bacterium]|nr:phage tail sheath subtilisin-like domain-containing protein [Chloroflexota bacterium]
MATSYQTPGIYVEEMPSGSHPIEGVGTSIAAFVGFAEMGPRNAPTLVTNWSQYRDKFGGFVNQPFTYYLPHAVFGYFNNGGTICYVVNIAPSLAPQATIPALPNGDGAAAAALEIHAVRQGLNPKLTGLGVTISYADQPAGGDAAPPAGDGGSSAPAVAPSASTPFKVEVRADNKVQETWTVTMDRESPLYVETVINGQSQFLWMTAPSGKGSAPAASAEPYALAKPASPSLQIGTTDFQGDVKARSGIAGLEAREDITIVAVPDLMSAFKQGLITEEGIIGLQVAMKDHSENMQGRVAILDAPPDLDPQAMSEWRSTLGIDSSYAMLYYPWIKVLDPFDPTGKHLLDIPPCGHMAGIWARTDSTRGVHKAPANETVRGVVNVSQELTDGEQGILNPIGVNCVRSFGAAGIRVWGARTLAEVDKSWKYINVRRLFNYIESSIKLGTRWAVFEPNDQSLWGKLKRDISAFLSGPYRAGALFGETPDQAFYVKCDAETNPADQIDNGMVVVEVGICPVKPAEFVIFRIQQLPTGG